MAIELAGTLELKEELLPNHLYAVDFSKLNSVNDLVLILASMGIVFESNHPNIERLRPFLNIENPFPIQQQEQSLPSLKKVK